jgi:hypothetical protein
VRESLLDVWFITVRPILVLVRALLVRPGYVARDYVEGKRKRFLGPYAFLFLIVGLASAAYVLSGFKVLQTKKIVLGTGPPGTEALNALAVAAAGDFFQRHVNIVILLSTPLLAAYSRLLFRRDGISFAEYLVLASYTSGMRSLFTTVIAIPGSLIILRLTGTDSVYFEAATLLLWFAYFPFATVQFSRNHRMSSGLKGVLAAVLAWVTGQIVLSAITMGFVLSHDWPLDTLYAGLVTTLDLGANPRAASDRRAIGVLDGGDLRTYRTLLAQSDDLRDGGLDIVRLAQTK